MFDPGAPQVEIDRYVIREVQYQLEVNRCRNEGIIVKDNFGWVWPIMGGAPQVNQCRNEEIIVKGNFGWVWSMWVQYQFEVNQCRNEEIIVKGNFGWVWPIWPGRPKIDLIVIREAQNQLEVNRCKNEEFQGSSANSLGGAGGQDGQTHINTISPLFLRKTWG
ncbi:hypothetical protein DPMN_086610 [Dreissena polymorpha]|uniref:Uncharacterized protein n=1 Tax=Dreissena polymorpha TaxID=45954 RepID=A0A9D4QVM5_DREPO|nr:hypothetical protein DPMN_086610 [Dreissena polymorpha]